MAVRTSVEMRAFRSHLFVGPASLKLCGGEGDKKAGRILGLDILKRESNT